MLPAYFTALGTSSSAATIPVTLKSTRNNGVSESVAGFVVPLGATVHLSGSMMKIGLFAFAVMYLTGAELTFGMALGFILMLGIMMSPPPAARRCDHGGRRLLSFRQLGFDESQIALMIGGLTSAMTHSTACNVTGDGARSRLTVNKIWRAADHRRREVQRSDAGGARPAP